LNNGFVPETVPASEHAIRGRGAGADHEMLLQTPEKKNPAVGTPGQIFLLSEFTVSSMRPGCCSVRPKARSGLLLLSSQFLFLFFYFLVLL
jgi:hypothetical protein